MSLRRPSGPPALRPHRVVAWAAAALLAASAASAGWLQLRDGTRVETAGPWEVRGRVVVFRQPNGTLASLRVAEVDLEASREGGPAAEGAPPPATAEEAEGASTAAPAEGEPAGRAATPPAGRRPATPGTRGGAAPDVVPPSPAAQPSTSGGEPVASRAGAGRFGNDGTAGTPPADAPTRPEPVVAVPAQTAAMSTSPASAGAVREPATELSAVPGEASAEAAPSPATLPDDPHATSPRPSPLDGAPLEIDGTRPASAAAEGGARVMDWRAAQGPSGGLTISGRLGGPTSGTATDLSLRVRLVGRDGEALASEPAQLSTRRLDAGQEALFRVRFSGEVRYQSVEFDVHSLLVAVVERPVQERR